MQGSNNHNTKINSVFKKLKHSNMKSQFEVLLIAVRFVQDGHNLCYYGYRRIIFKFDQLHKIAKPRKHTLCKCN